MCMAEDHDVRIVPHQPALDDRTRRADIDDVVHQKLALSQAHQFGIFEIEADVGVPCHGGNRSNCFQFEDDPWHPDVTRVQDMINTLEKIANLWIKMIVGI